MKASVHKRLYNWHSLTGLCSTVLLVALCLTALPAIFIKDISQWLTPVETITPIFKASHSNIDSNSSMATPSPQVPGNTLDTWINTADAQLNLAGQEFHIRSNAEFSPYTLWMSQQDMFKAFVLDEEGVFKEHNSASAAKILAEVHHNFLLPDPYGEYLVGLLGLAMLALVFMGVLLHKKWKTEKTQLRKHRSRRLLLSDLHKVLGLWLLPFHIFVSYTGATLGLGSLLIIVAAISAFNGDQDAAIAAALGKEPTMSQQQCSMQSPQNMTQNANQHWQDKYGENYITDIEIHGWLDCNAQITIASAIPGYLLASNALTYSLTTGKLINEIDWIPSGFGERWYALLGPLHFGTYAGYASQWLFFVSAILLAIMMVSGMLLWLNKQDTPIAKSLFIKSLTAGCMGISFASAMLLLVALLQNLNVTTINTSYDPLFYKGVYGFSFLFAAVICLLKLNLWKLVSYTTANILLVGAATHLYAFQTIGSTLTTNIILLLSAAVFVALPHYSIFKTFADTDLSNSDLSDSNAINPDLPDTSEASSLS